MAWDLIEEGEVHSSKKLILTYSYQQVLYVARRSYDWEQREECLKIEKYKTLVADRFCQDFMWSFHGGDEDMAIYGNGSAVPENGEGWHIGFTDGSVTWHENDMEIYDFMQEKVAEMGGFHWHYGGDWFKYWGEH